MLNVLSLGYYTVMLMMMKSITESSERGYS